MPQSSIAVPLDPETARAYESAGPEEKQKVQVLLALWARELATKDYDSLQSILDEIGSKAQGRGLTPEKLASLLKGA